MSTNRQWRVWCPSHGGNRASCDLILAEDSRSAAETWADHEESYSPAAHLTEGNVGFEICVAPASDDLRPPQDPPFEAWFLRGRNTVEYFATKASERDDRHGFDRLYFSLYGKDWQTRNASVEQRTMEEAAILVEMAHAWSKDIRKRMAQISLAQDDLLAHLEATRSSP